MKSSRPNCVRGSFARGFYSGLGWENIFRAVFWAVEESCRRCADREALRKLEHGCLCVETASALTAHLQRERGIATALYIEIVEQKTCFTRIYGPGSPMWAGRSSAGALEP